LAGISAIVITKDEEANIGRCLASLSFAREIVVVDSGSTDRTEEICRRDPRVRWFREEWRGFGPQKNLALDRAEGPWIFSIDADEAATGELARSVEEAAAREDRAPAGYRVARRSFFGRKWIRHGGWYPDRSVRLWRKGEGRFNERSVHESVQLRGDAGTLAGDLLHYTYRDIEDYLQRMNRYSTLGAEEMAKSGRSAGNAGLLFRPAFTFLKMYVLKRGFLDGAAGFRLAALYAVYTFSKYAKLAEAREGRDGEAAR
jgi:glycosyltransferase involved in cell wall biosynthesis